MMGWGYNEWGVGGWLAMSVLMIAFWGGLITLGVWVARSVRSDRGQSTSERIDALLAERFARGEIDGEEFARSRELLHAAGSSRPNSGR